MPGHASPRAAEPALAAHLIDATAAHAASAVSVVPAGAMTSVEVQAALQEIQTDATTGIAAAAAAQLLASTREQFFSTTGGANFGLHVALIIPVGVASRRFEFAVPGAAVTVTGIDLICTIAGNKVGWDIDLASEYGAVGESYQIHTGASAASTYTFVANQLTAINLLPVFASVAGGDSCGVLVTNNDGGLTLSVLGIRLRYTVA